MRLIRMIGPPAVESDGIPLPPPRGRKAWAVLAYLRLARRPVPRRHLAELLFTDADDPLGALRWSLAELRRAVGSGVEVSGDPLRLVAHNDTRFDLDLLVAGDDDLGVLAGGELLDGIQLPGCPQFEQWLIVARHQVGAAIEARLRQQAVVLLADGRARDAVPLAVALVERHPLDEGNQELLVRCLAATGDRAAALAQVAACADLFERELGTKVSSALREAATATPGVATGPPLSGHAAVTSQLEAGRAALSAGAVDAALQCLRRAATESAPLGDRPLHARALLSLGTALVHAARGRDEEGAVTLQRCVYAARDCGDRPTEVAALRELGFVEVQAGRRQTAAEWLGLAEQLASTPAELAGVLAIQGMDASDTGDYSAALARLTRSAACAAECGDLRQQAWSLSVLARAHLLRGEHEQAEQHLSTSLALVRGERWLAFLPWPQTLHAELGLARGDSEAAAYDLEQAWALACQLGDPCWEAMAARGLGLLHARARDRVGATRWLHDALARAVRVTDRYQWVHAYVLDAAAAQAISVGDDATGRSLTEALAGLAARCEMREMVVRAHLLRHRLGDPAALSAARLAAEDVDNPALMRELEEA